MAVYLMRFSYTSETRSKLIPEDRRDAANIEQVEGALTASGMGLGSMMVTPLRQAPDNVSMAGAALAIGRRRPRLGRTTAPMTVEETIEASARWRRA